MPFARYSTEAAQSVGDWREIVEVHKTAAGAAVEEGASGVAAWPTEIANDAVEPGWWLEAGGDTPSGNVAQFPTRPATPVRDAFLRKLEADRQLTAAFDELATQFKAAENNLAHDIHAEARRFSYMVAKAPSNLLDSTKKVAWCNAVMAGPSDIDVAALKGIKAAALKFLEEAASGRIVAPSGPVSWANPNTGARVSITALVAPDAAWTIQIPAGTDLADEAWIMALTE